MRKWHKLVNNNSVYLIQPAIKSAYDLYIAAIKNVCGNLYST